MFRKFRDALKPRESPQGSANSQLPDDEATEFEIGEEDWSLPLYDPSLGDVLRDHAVLTPAASSLFGETKKSMIDVLGADVADKSAETTVLTGTQDTSARSVQEDADRSLPAGPQTPSRNGGQSNLEDVEAFSPDAKRKPPQPSANNAWNCGLPIVPGHCLVGVGVVIFDEVEGPVVDWFYSGEEENLGGEKTPDAAAPSLNYVRGEQGTNAATASSPSIRGERSVQFPVLAPDVRCFSSGGSTSSKAKPATEIRKSAASGTAENASLESVELPLQAQNSSSCGGDLLTESSESSITFHEDLQPFLAFLSIPDGGHAVREDSFSTTYFILPTTKNSVLYGISLYGWQVCAGSKRGYRQSALVLLSKAPFFGHLRKRLLPIARICLLGETDGVRDILREWYDYIRQGITPHSLVIQPNRTRTDSAGSFASPAKNRGSSQISPSKAAAAGETTPSGAVVARGDEEAEAEESAALLSKRFLLPTLSDAELNDCLADPLLYLLKSLKKGTLISILKAILLERKIVVYSPSSEVCSSVVLALCSLLPGCSWFGFLSYAFGRQFFTCEKFGLPLRLFHEKNPVYPYLSLQLLDSLVCTTGFLVGTSNRLLVYNAETAMRNQFSAVAATPGRPETTEELDDEEDEDFKSTGNNHDVRRSPESRDANRASPANGTPGGVASSKQKPSPAARSSRQPSFPPRAPTTVVPDLVVMLPGSIAGANVTTHLRWTRPDVEAACHPTSADVKFQNDLAKLVKHVEPGQLLSTEERSCGLRTPFSSPKRKKRSSAILARKAAAADKKSSLASKTLAGVILPRSKGTRTNNALDGSTSAASASAQTQTGKTPSGASSGVQLQEPTSAPSGKPVDLTGFYNDDGTTTASTAAASVEGDVDMSCSPSAVQQFAMDDDDDAPIEVDMSEFREVDLGESAAQTASSWRRKKADAMAWYKQKSRAASEKKRALIGKLRTSKTNADGEQGSSEHHGAAGTACSSAPEPRKLNFSAAGTVQEDAGVGNEEQKVDARASASEVVDSADEELIAFPATGADAQNSPETTSSSTESDELDQLPLDLRTSPKGSSSAAKSVGEEDEDLVLPLEQQGQQAPGAADVAARRKSGEGKNDLEEMMQTTPPPPVNSAAMVRDFGRQLAHKFMHASDEDGNAPEQALARVDTVRRALWRRCEEFLQKLAFFAGEERSFDAYFTFSGATGYGKHRQTFKNSSLRDCTQPLSSSSFFLIPALDGVAPVAASLAASVAKQARAELGAVYGLSFALFWAVRTRSGRRFLKCHQLEVNPAQKKRPPYRGYGSYTWPQNGDSYQGQFQQGKRHGEGVYVSPEFGMRFDGQWVADKRHGHGLMTVERRKDNDSKQENTSGTSSSASNVADLKQTTVAAVAESDPKATQVFCYDGNWVNDERCGFGRCITTREKYSGQWQSNQFHGHGSYVSGDGRLIYDGDFERGRFHGMGKLTSHGLQAKKGATTSVPTTPVATSGAQAAAVPTYRSFQLLEDSGSFQYLGEFRDGKRHGEGQLRCVDESFPLVYVGGWRAGLRDGAGQMLLEVEETAATVEQSEQGEDHSASSPNKTSKETLLKSWRFDGTFSGSRGKHGRGKLSAAIERDQRKLASVTLTADWVQDALSCKGVSVCVVVSDETHQRNFNQLRYEGGVEFLDEKRNPVTLRRDSCAALSDGQLWDSSGSAAEEFVSCLRTVLEETNAIASDAASSSHESKPVILPLNFGHLQLRPHGAGKLELGTGTEDETPAENKTTAIEGVFKHGILASPHKSE
ncbi:unnamed protein product [Amoebophrya sp. A120]|nr:unnamed protein product [Amoebophrya sp. A120]|eukprot:GSA120T00018917001.1